MAPGMHLKERPEKRASPAALPASAMLRSTTQERPGSVTLVLEGRLCGAWTAEAEQAWLRIASSAEGQELAVDLAGVTFVDKIGESWLASVLGQGAKVKASGIWISHIVQEVERRL